ncbi:MAG: hypothetical protein LUG26_01645 [Ruminococcus sp.]|nr:hypothetical protein [Ruminococcus sp.]
MENFKPIPIGVEDFKEIIDKGSYYVDKTGMIQRFFYGCYRYRMNYHMKKILYEIVNAILCLFLLTSCSSQRNSDSTRFTNPSKNDESTTEVISQTNDSSAESENTKEEQETLENLSEYISYTCSTVVEEELNSNPID